MDLDTSGYMWSYGYGGSGWTFYRDVGSGASWVYFTWPFAYVLNGGEWYWMNGADVLWCYSFGLGQWSLFGVVCLLLADFGDAPWPYPTTLAENGPLHGAAGPVLGALCDVETDGVHSLGADADDTIGTDDEDGVIFGPIHVGVLRAEAVVIVNNAPAGAMLDAWLDLNADGTWGGPGEQIADGRLVTNGSNTVHFDVPAWAVDGTNCARFRISTDGNLGQAGAALDGEVEDHAMAVHAPLPGSETFITHTITKAPKH